MSEHAMTREQRDMAVAIARDILAQVNAPDPTIRPRHGRGYIETPAGGAPISGDLRDHLELYRGCRACFLGAAILAKAKLYDNVPMSTLVGGAGGEPRVSQLAAWKALGDVFDQATLCDMEAAFEEGTPGKIAKTPRVEAAIAWGGRFCGPLEVACAIAENLIANDGLFVVPAQEEDDPDAYENSL